MKTDPEDSKLSLSMDVLAPEGYGEIIGGGQREDDLKVLQWADRIAPGEGHVDWTPFQHPQLGKVEIGGWNRMAVFVNPPPAQREQETARFPKWLLWQALVSPKLELRGVEVTPAGGGSWRIRLVVENSGWRDRHNVLIVLQARDGDALAFAHLDGELQHKGGTVKEIYSGNFNIDETVLVFEDGAKLTMMHKWPVRQARPVTAKLAPTIPLRTGQRVVDGFFSLTKGRTAAIPGGFRRKDGHAADPVQVGGCRHCDLCGMRRARQ